MVTQPLSTRTPTKRLDLSLPMKSIGAALIGGGCVYALNFLLVMLLVSIFGLRPETDPGPISVRILAWTILSLALFANAMVSAVIAALSMSPSNQKQALIFGIVSTISMWGAWLGSFVVAGSFGGRQVVRAPDTAAEFGLAALIPFVAGVCGGLLVNRFTLRTTSLRKGNPEIDDLPRSREDNPC